MSDKEAAVFTCAHENTEEITVVRPTYQSAVSTRTYTTKRCKDCYWRQEIGGSQFIDPKDEVNPWGDY